MVTKIPICPEVPPSPTPSAAHATGRATQKPAKRQGRVHIETYGCQMNVSDSELMLGVLREAGYTSATSLDDADVILVNTCAIRDNAEQRVWGRLGHFAALKRRRPDLVVGVTGCMAKHVGERLTAQSACVDLMVGPDGYRDLPALIAAAQDGTQLRLGMNRAEHYLGVDPARQAGPSGWVTIMRGCDKFCTFCIVPFVRGRERSVPAGEVVRHVEEMAADGFKEVTLLGQTVNAYHAGDVGFGALLKRVARVPGIRRLRFTSPHPSDFDAETIDVIASHPNIMEHIHLPVQSGADRVLKAMRRDYTVADYRRLVERLRAAMPAVTLTTDIIVGFPGETDLEFEATLQLVREVGYESAFTFLYSERDGTPAARSLPDSIPRQEKVARLNNLINLQEGISAERNRAWEGRRVEVLAHGPSRKDPEDWYGRTEQLKTVIFPPPPAMVVGDCVEVVVERSTSHTLFGSCAASPGAG